MKHINQIILLFSLSIPCLSHAIWTDLHSVVFYKEIEKVQQLITDGANVNAPNPDDGTTPLHLAMTKAVAELLLKNGAKVNATDMVGTTLLHSAVRRGNEAIVKLLLEKNAEVNAVNYCETPLHAAARNGNKPIVMLLLDAGANVNATNYQGLTPLDIAESTPYHSKKVATLLKRCPKYQNLLKKNKEQMYVFLMATHPRLGANSPAKALPKELFQHIWKFVKPD